MNLGRLEKVELRDVWKTEAQDKTLAPSPSPKRSGEERITG